jgi:integrase
MQIGKRTAERWAVVFDTLDGLPEPITDQRGAQRWLDGLVNNDRSPRTVRDIWLSAARAVYGWAARHHKIDTNPFKGCKVEVPRQKQTRETGKAFTSDEAQTILRAALLITVPPRGKGTEWAAVRRWVPWVCAYTGARVGEITQLRVLDIERRPSDPKGPLGGADYPVLRITPDAGTVKTSKVRVVPIHSDLVEQGFLRFVEDVKSRLGPDAPLFYKRPTKPSRNPNYRGPASKAAERLAEWVRGLGITDPGILPNHAWRHTWKTCAARADIEEGMRDAICGHSSRMVGRGYEHFTPEDMAEAVWKFPRWTIEGVDQACRAA